MYFLTPTQLLKNEKKTEKMYTEEFKSGSSEFEMGT
jgi:hypothetical protein